jgi:Uma2 family endonuclease
MTVNAKLMTADELLALPDDGTRRELVRGELRTMPPGGLEQGDRSSVLDGSLGVYVRARKLGRVFTNEPGFVLNTDPDTVRSPDLAFIRAERLRETGVPGGYYRHGAPDLAVEVISPNDRYTEVGEKVAEWLEHGALLVFVVDPRRRTVAVHRHDGSVRMLGLNDVLDGEEVVPGWSLPVRELFE